MVLNNEVHKTIFSHSENDHFHLLVFDRNGRWRSFQVSLFFEKVEWTNSRVTLVAVGGLYIPFPEWPDWPLLRVIISLSATSFSFHRFLLHNLPYPHRLSFLFSLHIRVNE